MQINSINNTSDRCKSRWQDILITRLKTGDLVKVRSEIFPLIFHYGIVCREGEDFYVYHNDPDKTNRSGGNIIRENFMDWISGRELMEVVCTDLDVNNIESMVDQLKTERYHLLLFNCEHFISRLRKQKPTSQQLVNWAVAVSAIVITIAIIRKRK